MAPVRYLDTDKDDGGVIPGVPKRDLEQDEYDALPAWLQASVDASPCLPQNKTGGGTRTGQSKGW
jgi:hypothetical protein